MKIQHLAALAALSFAASVSAQDSPDGTPAFGFEPYIGVMGGMHQFDRSAAVGVSLTSGRMNGELIEGVAGFNVPLGPMFIGAEGLVAKGFRDIDWEYGGRVRAGVRAGDSGMLFGSAGYTWVKPRSDRGFEERHDWVWGIGFEVGPRDLGIGGVTGEGGPRLRVQVETKDFDSLRPMAGVIFHF